MTDEQSRAAIERLRNAREPLVRGLLIEHRQMITWLLESADWAWTGWAIDPDDPAAVVLFVEDSGHTTGASAQDGMIAQVRVSQLLQRTCVVVHTARQDERTQRLLAIARPVPEASHE